MLIVLMAVGLGLQLRPSLSDYPRVEALGATGESEADGLSVRYYGTATLSLTRQRQTVVVDGFVTRPSLWALFKPLKPDVQRLRQTFSPNELGQVLAVMVGHNHYDHAMDAPDLARLFGAEVWGSEATAQLARAENYGRSRLMVAGRAETVGGFTITPFDLPHAPGGLMMGDYEPDFAVPARVGDYRFGGGQGYVVRTGWCRLLVVPSAGLPEQDLSAYPSDVVFLSVGQLGHQNLDYVRRYWQATVEATGATWVVPIHWDDFTRPLDKPFKPLPLVLERADKALQMISELAGPDVTVVMPLQNQSMDLPPLRQCD